jgi:ABC-type multidrug transport system fused ATPase/permease subunit
VLQRLDLDVPAGTSLGLCGRTGAGKSSALAALLRLVEVSAGGIAIDGVDVRSVPLRRLRRAVGYVPQAPFVFSGTLRDNLDPLGGSEDGKLMDALRQTGLSRQLAALGEERAKGPSAGGGAEGAAAQRARAAPSREGGAQRSVLNTRLGHGGASLSLGQQQLLSVARMLLRRPKLVLLDECSACVDPDTAAAMQQAVGTGLAGATVIEVAHRLSSIARCDAVAVMEAGRVVELGSPGKLAAQRGSAFGEMLRQQEGSAVHERAREAAAGRGCRAS